MKQLNQLYKTIMCYRQQLYRIKPIITIISSWTKWFQLLLTFIIIIVKSYGHIINTYIHTCININKIVN